MSAKYILPVLLCTALLSGCSASKSARKSKRQTATETVMESNKNRSGTTQPESESGREPSRQEKKTEQKAQQRPVQPEPKMRPRIEFTEAESAHVRTQALRDKGFPPSGEIVLIPEALREEFCYPYPGKLISPYGWRGRSMHTGIDIKAVPNDTIRAAFPGVVRMSKLYSSYGNVVVIRHYNGIETLYSHNSKNLVKVNDAVEAGTPIALAGRTGRATTEHLHFEVRAATEHIDPTLLVDPAAQELRNDTLYLYYWGGQLFVEHQPTTEKELRASAGTKAAAAASASAAAPQQAQATADAQYYRVKQGDTLSAIARRFGTSVNRLCQLNDIRSTSILQINQRLRVR